MYYKFIEDDKVFVMATNNDIISILPQYDYTISQINVVDTKEDLFNLLYAYLKNDMIYYVNDIGKYYKLVNIDEHLNDNGWHEIDFDSLEDAKDIYRIQNIIDTNKGNNPHTGNYDNGRKYVNAYESFFTNSEFNNVDK
jgi:hypothetical protein